MKSRVDSKTGQEGRVLRVGVLGCGNIAKYHLRFIDESAHAELVAIADMNVGAARKLAEQYPVENVCGSLEEMLDTCALDLVHVLTPPFLHKANAIAAIERGVHVFVEKPIAFSRADVEDLYERARRHGVKLCPDFCQLFQPNMHEALARIRSGELGRPVHVEFNWGLDVNEPHVRESVGTHWSFSLPGGFLHNYISHPLYLVLSVAGAPRRVNVISKHFGILPQGLTDHLTIQCEGEHCTASVVLSLVNKPNPYYCQVFCERGSIFVNFETQTTLVHTLGSMPRAIQRATANFAEGQQLARNGIRNIVNFARGRLVPYQGLKTLLDAYHSSPRGRLGASCVVRTVDGRRHGRRRCRRTIRKGPPRPLRSCLAASRRYATSTGPSDGGHWTCRSSGGATTGRERVRRAGAGSRTQPDHGA